MLIDLSPEQRALQAELREYFAGLMSEAERATLLRDRHGTVHREVVRRMGRDGWLGVGWPREYGGRGFGPIEQQIFVNEAARADVPLPAGTTPTTSGWRAAPTPTHRNTRASRSSSSTRATPATRGRRSSPATGRTTSTPPTTPT